MKIYRISRKDIATYYQYHSAVVVANNPEEARYTHPDGNPNGQWWGLRGPRIRSWVQPKDVLVEEIGTANPSPQNFPYVVTAKYQGLSQ